MNIQAETNQDEEKGLVYNHDEARVLTTVITTFNKHMEHIVEEHRQQYVVTNSLKAGSNKYGNQAMTEFRQPLQVQSHLEMPRILVQLGHTQCT